jgi:hypothetical protein
MLDSNVWHMIGSFPVVSNQVERKHKMEFKIILLLSLSRKILGFLQPMTRE